MQNLCTQSVQIQRLSQFEILVWKVSCNLPEVRSIICMQLEYVVKTTR